LTLWVVADGLLGSEEAMRGERNIVDDVRCDQGGDLTVSRECWCSPALVINAPQTGEVLADAMHSLELRIGDEAANARTVESTDVQLVVTHVMASATVGRGVAITCANLEGAARVRLEGVEAQDLEPGEGPLVLCGREASGGIRVDVDGVGVAVRLGVRALGVQETMTVIVDSQTSTGGTGSSLGMLVEVGTDRLQVVKCSANGVGGELSLSPALAAWLGAVGSATLSAEVGVQVHGHAVLERLLVRRHDGHDVDTVGVVGVATRVLVLDPGIGRGVADAVSGITHVAGDVMIPVFRFEAGPFLDGGHGRVAVRCHVVEFDGRTWGGDTTSTLAINDSDAVARDACVVVLAGVAGGQVSLICAIGHGTGPVQHINTSWFAGRADVVDADEDAVRHVDCTNLEAVIVGVGARGATLLEVGNEGFIDLLGAVA